MANKSVDLILSAVKSAGEAALRLHEENKAITERLAAAEALLRIAQKSCDRETAACIDAFLSPDSASHRENERE